MIKLLIADDEMIIRSGLMKSLDWTSLGIEIVGEAENGRMALELATDLRPDLMLVDINMPYINGLELIEKLRLELPNALFVIITGYDEFEYAQKALRLNVFEYILKPFKKKDLQEIIERAVTVLKKNEQQQKYLNWVEKHMSSSKKDIVQGVFKNWLSDRVSAIEVHNQLSLYNVPTRCCLGIIGIKPLNIVETESKQVQMDQSLLNFCIQNIFEEIGEKNDFCMAFEDDEQLIIGIVSVGNIEMLNEMIQDVRDMINTYLSYQSIFSGEISVEGIEGLNVAYKRIKMDLQEQSSYTPIIMLVKSYIERFYYQQDLSLQSIADKVEISPPYLSKLFKKEVGCNLIEYLTKVRIDKAIVFMNNPTVKMYEVAEKVGYNTQHYFSASFKKIIGVSPYEYKNRKR